ncbi:MGMT family protein [Lysobacter niastensis]|uniref:MGMT family protein n=1 Tax=Lysobacter niastensis TaxID=380629 RepID=A0ABS0B3C8_9GAMM|nr:MGMT family protein [Lysobacter niastensis]MBF6022838.1 MGMT family protein [Lysobacter niastensis]
MSNQDAARNAERILAAIRAIPRGEVAGYGEVARRAGLPGRARLVARLLSENGDRDLPWHRVMRSDGRIAFPEGSKGFREQSQRLRAEGVHVEAGRVRGLRAAATLDEQMWGEGMHAETAAPRKARRAPAKARVK